MEFVFLILIVGLLFLWLELINKEVKVWRSTCMILESLLDDPKGWLYGVGMHTKGTFEGRKVKFSSVWRFGESSPMQLSIKLLRVPRCSFMQRLSHPRLTSNTSWGGGMWVHYREIDPRAYSSYELKAMLEELTGAAIKAEMGGVGGVSV